ncbi:MAG: 50S ribosomal protein L31e [Candidatus Woesearchaeota archaeon]
MATIHTIPLRRSFQKVSFKRKTNKAMKALKEYVYKHTKAENVIVGQELNELVWANGITNPPAKVTVEITKVKDGVFVNLVGVGKKEVEVKKKLGVKTGMKDKLNEAVETLKTKKPAEKVVDVESAETKETEKTATKKVEPKTDAKETETKAEKVETKKADTKTEEKPATEKKAEAKESTKVAEKQ